MGVAYRIALALRDGLQIHQERYVYYKLFYEKGFGMCMRHEECRGFGYLSNLSMLRY